MATPQQYIPQTDPYSIPTGFQTTTTNGGGTAYLDPSTNSKYVRDAGGFKLFNDIQAPSSLPGVVSSSAPVVQDENNLKGTIAGFALPDTGVADARSASADYTKLIDDRISTLEQRRKDEIAGINATFDQNKLNLEDKQKRETGTYNVALQRIGGYLGESASATGALLNLAKTHRDEVGNLEAKRQAAIQEANNAISDKQFDLARLKAAEVKDLSKEIFDRKNKFFDQATKLQEEQRAQSQLEIQQSKEQRDRVNDIVEKTAPSLFQTLSTITDETMKEAYIQKAATTLGVNAEILKGGLINYQTEKNKKINDTILDLVTKYPDSGISNADIAASNISSVINKVTQSRSYRLANAEVQASIDAKLASAAKDRLAIEGGGDLSGLAAAAETWATTGKAPTGLTPKDPRYGVVYQMAKQIPLPPGSLVDSTTGLSVTPADFTAQEKTSMNAAFKILNYDIPKLKAYASQLDTFAGKAALNAIGEKVGLKSEVAQQFDALRNSVLTEYAQSVSGVAISEQEFARLSKLLPSQNKLSKYNKIDLDNFEEQFKSKISSFLSTKGAQVVGLDLRNDKEKAEDNKKAAQFDSP